VAGVPGVAGGPITGPLRGFNRVISRVRVRVRVGVTCRVRIMVNPKLMTLRDNAYTASYYKPM
jgi:hypothetical protein